MSILTKRLPSGRVEFELKNPYGHLKRITESDVERISESNFQSYGPFDEEVHFDIADTLEEVALDDIEISESTPLLDFSATPSLAEAGGIAAVGAPATSTVGAAVGVGVGTVLVGSTIVAINTEDDKHKDPVVSLPGHKYIGPGNTIDDTQPIDVDDSIAREHDINYENAKTQEDIQEADKHGADDFLSDVIDNHNPHSVVGYIGLKAKEAFEKTVGVQYPANLPSSVSGMSSRVIRALGKYPIDKDPRKHEDFPKRSELSPGTFINRARYVWDQWNRARQNRGLPRIDPPNRLGIGTTMRPPFNKQSGTRPDNKSITFKEWQRRNAGKAGPLIDAFNKTTEKPSFLDSVVAHDITDEERMDVEAILADIDSGSISFADFDNRDGAGPSNAPQHEAPPTMVETRGSKRPAEGGQGGAEAPPQPTPASAVSSSSGTTPGKGSDGGFDSAQGPVSFLPTGGYQAKGGMMKFTKVHRMKSWAIPYWVLADTGVHSGANMVTTPLAKIPWEYAFFYLSPEEFNLLPAGAYIDSVHIKVMQTVAQTGYPTGTTTASVATTNHPKILVIGKDLEKKCRGGCDRSLAFDSNMIPSFNGDRSVESIYDDFIAKQYGTDQTAADGEIVVPGAAHKIPYYNKGHFCIYQPNRAQALARGFFTESEPGVVANNYSPGFEYFQNYVTEMNSNDTSWDYVDSMSYKFESAPIGVQYPQLEILTTQFTNSTGNQSNYFNAKRNVDGTTPNANFSISESIVQSNRASLPMVTYKTAPMEFGSYFVRGDSANKPTRQPSYHIGMRSIDKLDPAVDESRASTFVQANIEFEIEATMYVNLPSYPNRFTKPKFYNTSMENAVQGIGAYPSHVSTHRFVTFGLYNETDTAPVVAEVDAVSRRTRSLPTISVVPPKPKKKKVT
uniref:VP n=1 Tax=uncultured densovirus TaxID=748192 RepID=A0A7L7YQP0_9VIRU|nr:VP [uncultured densovirus]